VPHVPGRPTGVRLAVATTAGGEDYRDQQAPPDQVGRSQTGAPRRTQPPPGKAQPRNSTVTTWPSPPRSTPTGRPGSCSGTPPSSQRRPSPKYCSLDVYQRAPWQLVRHGNIKSRGATQAKPLPFSGKASRSSDGCTSPMGSPMMVIFLSQRALPHLMSVSSTQLVYPALGQVGSRLPGGTVTPSRHHAR
jgi:hypothetical protein